MQKRLKATVEAAEKQSVLPHFYGNGIVYRMATNCLFVGRVVDVLVEVKESGHTPVFADEGSEHFGIRLAVITERLLKILGLAFGDVRPLFDHILTSITGRIAAALC